MQAKPDCKIQNATLTEAKIHGKLSINYVMSNIQTICANFILSKRKGKGHRSFDSCVFYSWFYPNPDWCFFLRYNL